MDFEFKLLYSIGKKKSITAVAGIEHLTEFATIGCIHIPFVKPAKNGDDHTKEDCLQNLIGLPLKSLFLQT